RERPDVALERGQGSEALVLIVRLQVAQEVADRDLAIRDVTSILHFAEPLVEQVNGGALPIALARLALLANARHPIGDPPEAGAWRAEDPPLSACTASFHRLPSLSAR